MSSKEERELKKLKRKEAEHERLLKMMEFEHTYGEFDYMRY